MEDEEEGEKEEDEETEMAVVRRKLDVNCSGNSIL